MAERSSAVTFGKQFRTLFDLGALGATPDRGLLDHFARGGESAEAAFATMVERHGPMVLRVCRHLLADGHLAEDAFQVTFLLLARRARSIQNPDALAGWLHRVARRVALRAFAGLRRRRVREGSEAGAIAVSADNGTERDEVCAIVHQEIDRLSDGQRLPILLCALEGLSHEEAAQRLRWPVGTVKSRLARGRLRLKGRLSRRGLAPAVALVAGATKMPASAATVPVALAVATTRAAVRSALGTAATAGAVRPPVAAPVRLLLQQELTAMALARVAVAGGAALAAGAAVFLIAMTLALPLNRTAQGIEPVQPKMPTPRVKRPFVSHRDLARTVKTDRALPASPPVIPGGEPENSVVSHPQRRLSAFGEQAARAMRDGVQFLKGLQRDSGSWDEVEQETRTGATSLVTLALLAAGEKPDSPTVEKALAYLRAFGPGDLRSTYAISLQTQVFAAARPERDRALIAANVDWLERAQIKPGDLESTPGAWTYSIAVQPGRLGDNSNSQFALLGLFAASEAGVPVSPSVWESAHAYWARTQKADGSWAYTRNSAISTASMTCAGVSSLIISGIRRAEGEETLTDNVIQNCGRVARDRNLQAGIYWLTSHFRVDQNFGGGEQWRLYYFDGLERAGRLAGIRFFGQHDWYRSGALELVLEQNKPGGFWQGALFEQNKVLATSFALLFLANGRTPVLINKLRHSSADDWDNDPNDVRNIVSAVARDWKHPLTWQTVDAQQATVPDLLEAPILFINGHRAPEFTIAQQQHLREYAERGGVILAEACCGSADFDTGFRKLIRAMFPAKADELRPLREDHPIWRAKHRLSSEIRPLFGVHRGGRTLVIYSAKDLSCYWNQSLRSPSNPAVATAVKIGQNIIDHVTQRTLPPDKLSER
jgi:RNA polymerase sigma factor (sigma-70 family)